MSEFDKYIDKLTPIQRVLFQDLMDTMLKPDPEPKPPYEPLGELVCEHSELNELEYISGVKGMQFAKSYENPSDCKKTRKMVHQYNIGMRAIEFAKSLSRINLDWRLKYEHHDQLHSYNCERDAILADLDAGIKTP